MAQAGPSKLVVKEAEEWALAGVVAMESRRVQTPSSSSLRMPIAMAFIRSLFFLLFLVSFVFSSDGVFSSDATAELERLRAAADAFLDFLGVALGTQEERLWNTCCHVLDAIESGIHRGTGVALAMAEVSVEVDLTGVSGFPAGEELCYHEDLVARYGPTREAMAAHVLIARVLAMLPLIRVFLLVFCFACGVSTPFIL
jgi:hypothetical protein